MALKKSDKDVSELRQEATKQGKKMDYSEVAFPKPKPKKKKGRWGK